MRLYRLCRSIWPADDGKGARLAGRRWNSKGLRVVYTSENRSLAILEVLAHLSDLLPDGYVLGVAALPADITPDVLDAAELRGKSSVALSVPSVTSGERNYLLNPEHPGFAKIAFLDPFGSDSIYGC
jgi:RES domain-containing protein